MRKQTDVVIRVLALANVDAGMEQMTTATASRFLRETYLIHGYEVISTQVAQVSSAGVINICFTLVKYEDVPEPEQIKENVTKSK